jgi:hypothetical protein
MQEKQVNYLKDFRAPGSYKSDHDKKNWISTLHGMEGQITNIRLDGNSTRIVDNAIQLLFQGHVIVCHDHFEYGKNHSLNSFLYKKVLDRIDFLMSKTIACGAYLPFTVDKDKNLHIIEFVRK